MAAQTLVEAGKNVLLIDGGITDDHYQKLQPDADFLQLRNTDKTQHRYFLGDKFESLPDDELGTGAQLTPARQFLIRHTEQFLPSEAENFSAMESLALGGLGGGWGLGCCVFSENEMKLAGLSPGKMNPAYQVIADRIGINSEKDDARKFTAAHLERMQAPPPPDLTAQKLLSKYSLKKKIAEQKRFFSRSPCACFIDRRKKRKKASSAP